MKNPFASYTSTDIRSNRKGQRTTFSFLLLFASILIFLAFLLAPADADAREVSHYATESKLASGKWAKVKVSASGMQFISNATLAKLGFRNPKDVRVYGFGGRLLPETLTNEDPDDLPLTPSLVTDKGIYFFGYDHIRWTPTTLLRDFSFTHTMQAYAEESWYFLTDSTPDAVAVTQAPAVEMPADAGVVTRFIQPLLHEVDLFHPSNTGARYLGEDFRSPTARAFDFNLTDAVPGESVYTKYAFATHTSSPSTLHMKATGKNGNVVENSTTLRSPLSSEMFMRYETASKALDDMGESLRIDLSFKGEGTIKLARLDYIEVHYKRHLRLAGGQLHFTLLEKSPAVVKVGNTEGNTVVWDITDPMAPVAVATTQSGNELLFSYPGGVREYVAFTPDKCGNAINEGAAVLNQNIHALPVPDMLIIAPANMHDAAGRLAQHHADHDGLKVQILSPETIYNEFSSGTSDPTAFRRLLKMWYDRGNVSAPQSEDHADTSGQIKYCLIFGRATYDHKRLMENNKNASWPVVPIWQSLTGETQTASYCCEDYIGMLEDAPTFAMNSARLNVAVGRFPVISPAEASMMVDKYINYVTKPQLGFWRNQMMLIADDQNGGAHLTQSEDMMKGLLKTDAGKNLRYEKIYLDAYKIENSSVGQEYPHAKEKMLRLWNDGVFFINYIGHANPTSWTHENLLNWTDINSFANRNLPFLYAATCEFGRIDADTRSGAEVLWAYPSSGIIGTITPARSVYIDPNGVLTKEMGKIMFKYDEQGKAMRIGDVMTSAKNNYPGANDNKLRFTLIGNPAMRIPLPALKVNVDAMSDKPVDDSLAPADYPVLPARSRINLSGHIADKDNSVVENFSGIIDIVLYDAENSVETFGNGSEGVVSYYNDRRTLLYRGKAKVADGKWSTTILLPSEIENNYSPAQFLFYASSDDAREAHGEYSDFYVYGYDESGAEDSKGPAIEYFTLNHKDFDPKGCVHTSPVVMARISDDSGVNISAAGIGHQMTLVLDGKTVFNDVTAYFTPDPDDFTAGTIAYPLSDIAPGKHSLKFNVWDNSLNSTTAVLDFEVAVNKAPEIFALSTDVNPAREKVNFTLSTDMPMAKMDCKIEVFDLNGKRVWSSEIDASTDIEAGIRVAWNLCDANGVRVPRGIYVYRATVTTPEGRAATKSYKLAVTAP
ncbi:MAG: type IX secretion system sortase PorU [Muribaculaceae bacterium]|nr:type IX secretion system sortase PorU [Muribaculaceae bacterium]